MAAIYTVTFAPPSDVLAPALAWDSIDQALIAAESLAPDSAVRITETARAAFDERLASRRFCSLAIVNPSQLDPPQSQRVCDHRD